MFELTGVTIKSRQPKKKSEKLFLKSARAPAACGC